MRLRLDQLIMGDEAGCLPTQNPGYVQDQMVREQNLDLYGEDSLCKSCDGTGNAFYFHYKACRLCKGTGVIGK